MDGFALLGVDMNYDYPTGEDFRFSESKELI